MNSLMTFFFIIMGFLHFKIMIEEMEDCPKRLMCNGGAQLGIDSSILTHSMVRSNGLVKMFFIQGKVGSIATGNIF
jgi:hypothetical protein